MKRLLTLIIALVMMLTMASCYLLPEDLQATIDDLENSILGGDSADNGNHTHDFAVVESKKAYCAKDGWQKLECECGEKKEEVIPALGHIWGECIEASRLICCTRLGCDKTQLTEGNGKYADMLSFTFGDTEKAALSAKHEELASILKNADKYDKNTHKYSKDGALAEAYAAAETLYEEYSDMILEAQGQYSIAMTLYYCDHKNTELEAIYNDMMNYYTELVAKFYSLSQPWYDSMFREFFFYGATEEEINAFLFDSSAYANEEYTRLKNRNDAIELEFNNIPDPTASNAPVAELYYEFVQNNNRMAEILGYDNYLEYAYENMYDREYTYQDAASFVEYVRRSITPAYNSIYSDWGRLTSGNISETIIDQYYDVVSNSFFSDMDSNKLFNDYIDDMAMAFTSNPDKTISFSDCLNDLMADGNLFRGSYEGAYVTYVRGANLPIAYFGKDYDKATTVAHEFGHYMNEIYNEDAYSQSFDLLETHSQGQEMLFIYYVKSHIDPAAVKLVETYHLLSTIQTIMLSVQVDCFERAVYLDYYDGPGSEEIMADGTITADEYDALYAGLSQYLGIYEHYRVDEYWRYGMTISSPCYYISYAVSGINALQIYVKANNESFEAAKDSYLKLFTYTDADLDGEMNLNDVLEYAGLLSFTDEQTYAKIYSFVNSR